MPNLNPIDIKFKKNVVYHFSITPGRRLREQVSPLLFEVSQLDVWLFQI